MKRLILSMASSLVISMAAVNAQDTTRTQDRPQQEQDDQQQNTYRAEDMTAIDRSEIPEAVVVTLDDPKYEGWEKGVFYLDPVSGLYIIEVEGESELPLQYRFDKSGNVVDDQSAQDEDNQVSPPRDPNQPEQDQDVQNPSPTDPNRENDTDSTMMQQDTDSTMMQQEKSEQQEADAQTQHTDYEQQQQYRTDEMVVVEVDDVPVGIVETLKDPKYTGWERKAVFLDPASGEYVVDVEKSGEPARQLRFDRSGQDISDREKMKKDGSERKKNHGDQDQTKQSDKSKKKKDY